LTAVELLAAARQELAAAIRRLEAVREQLGEALDEFTEVAGGRRSQEDARCD
jgi:hypothetical protein